MSLNFSAPRSNFWKVNLSDGVLVYKLKYGAWCPTYFAYIMIGKVQWLYVGDKPYVVGGVALQKVEPGCNISGMVALESPMLAACQHKIFA